MWDGNGGSSPEPNPTSFLAEFHASCFWNRGLMHEVLFAKAWIWLLVMLPGASVVFTASAGVEVLRCDERR